MQISNPAQFTKDAPAYSSSSSFPSVLPGPMHVDRKFYIEDSDGSAGSATRFATEDVDYSLNINNSFPKVKKKKSPPSLDDVEVYVVHRIPNMVYALSDKGTFEGTAEGLGDQFRELLRDRYKRLLADAARS